MKKICEEKGIQFLVPIIDVKTRWNSTYDMLLRASSLKDIISDTIYASKDNRLISLLLNDSDWECVNLLLEILNPLKEVTLLSSKGSKNLTVVDTIPMYTYCTEMLVEKMRKIEKDDDIYSGLECAIEKLNHYCDMISPMVGIALILSPAMKMEFLRDSLCWEKQWVESVNEHFTSAFDFYKGEVTVGSAFPITNSLSGESSATSAFAEFRKRKRSSLAISATENENVRYIEYPNVSQLL